MPLSQERLYQSTLGHCGPLSDGSDCVWRCCTLVGYLRNYEVYYIAQIILLGRTTISKSSRNLLLGREILGAEMLLERVKAFQNSVQNFMYDDGTVYRES